MRGMWILIVVVTLTVSICTSKSHAGHFWRPYVEMETRGGDIWAGQGNMFVPLRQSEVNLLFADLRGNWTDVQSQHGNLGLGFRQMLVNDWIFGIHSHYDIRHSQFGNNFHQASLGLEMMNTDWGIRWNGYLAGEGAKLLQNQNRVQLDGNQLFIEQAAERAYSGHDFEVERRLWYREAPSDNSWHGWGTFHDMELWGSLGVYNYDNDAAGFEQITGPRTRLELRIYDIPFAGPDSRLVMAGQFEQDDVRGSVNQAMLTVRIPFGRGTDRPRSRLRCLNRRMVAPIQRNTDIISVAGFQARDEAAFARNGRQIDRVVTVDAGTIAVDDDAIEDAGENSLVIVDGSAGTLSPVTSIDLVNGQTIIGGGSSLLVQGVNSGATAVFTAPGDRPTIDSGNNIAFNLTGVDPADPANPGNDVCLIGLDIVNSGAGVRGVNMSNVANVLMQDINVNVSGDNAFGIFADNSQFIMNDSTINTSGANGDAIRLIGDDLVANIGNASISTSAADAHGVFMQDMGLLSLQGSRIFTSGDGAEGIDAVGSAQLQVNNSVITATGTSVSAIVATPGAGDELAIALLNSTVNATADGLVLGAGFNDGILNATIVGNSITTPVGVDEIDVQTNGAAVANLNIQANTIDNVTGTIRLDEIGGDINVSQSATGISSTNGLPPTNVLTPAGAIDFEEPAPPAPQP